MAVVTGNPHADYVITVIVTYAVSFATLAYNAAQNFYYLYPDVALGLSLIVGALLLIYTLRNIVAIAAGLIKTLIKLTILLTIAAVGSWIYVRGFDNFVSDFKQVITHFSEIDARDVNEYASQLKQQAAPLKDFVAEQYESLY